MGLHSYLTCLRDRLLLSRELLHPSGSILVQISDDNLHHVREVLDEVFGADNFCSLITFAKSSSTTSELLPSPNDFLLWYARDRQRVKYRQLFTLKQLGAAGGEYYTKVRLADGNARSLTEAEIANPTLLPSGSRVYRLDNLISQGFRQFTTVPFEFEGKTYHPGPQMNWKTTVEGMQRLAAAGRIEARSNSLAYVRYLGDFPVFSISSTWTDTGIAGRPGDKMYVVQTSPKVVERCLQMTTDPGDLVLDPTCGSGTTAYVAEQWGRRWIAIEVSRVPLALARQRLLTATFPWYELKDDDRGPVGGFVYRRKQNRKAEEVGGIVPHVTLKSIANNEPPPEEVLVDRPEVVSSITRVTGPFHVEATIPTAVEWAPNGKASNGAATTNGEEGGPQRMLEVLRKSPVLRLEGNRKVTVHNVRPPAKTLSLSAEAVLKNGDDKPVAFVFGTENGPVSEKLVQAAMKEANLKAYTHLYVIGFAIQPNARLLIEQSVAMGAIPTTYVQATPDLLMGDLLKNMRSSHIFSVCGLPEVEVKKHKGNGKNGRRQYQVSLLGLDVFDPATMEAIHRRGDDVPAWFLDTDYNDKCFHVCQAFFPRTAAWDHLKKALKSTHEEGVWDHLAGTMSAPFEAGEEEKIAVKVIDDRGNELMVVKSLNGVRR